MRAGKSPFGEYLGGTAHDRRESPTVAEPPWYQYDLDLDASFVALFPAGAYRVRMWSGSIRVSNLARPSSLTFVGNFATQEH